MHALFTLNDYTMFLVSIHLFKTITTDVVVQGQNQYIILRTTVYVRYPSDDGPQFRERFTE